MDNNQNNNDSNDVSSFCFFIVIMGLFLWVLFGVFLPASNVFEDIEIAQENKAHISEYIPEVVNYKIIISEEDYWVENYTIDDELITIERYWDNTGSLLDLENYFKYYTSPTIISSNFTIIPLK
jgi:uncharacterized protein with PQ loop repeat